ncbi:MAG UNVERIFIED_CONTAM: hypothetical protein LVQ98_05735 [Rickettsiaceae bacterium]
MQVVFLEQRFPDVVHMLKAFIVMCLSIIASYFIYKKLSRNVIYYL